VRFQLGSEGRNSNSSERQPQRFEVGLVSTTGPPRWNEGTAEPGYQDAMMRQGDGENNSNFQCRWPMLCCCSAGGTENSEARKMSAREALRNCRTHLRTYRGASHGRRAGARFWHVASQHVRSRERHSLCSLGLFLLAPVSCGTAMT